MVTRFVQIVMVLLALGISSPQTSCAAGTSAPGQMCCCTGTPVCKCQPDTACKQSCTLAQIQSTDKQTPARTLQETFGLSPILLALIVPTKINYLVLNPSVRRSDSNAAPPLGGSPPQALLCLWRV